MLPLDFLLNFPERLQKFSSDEKKIQQTYLFFFHFPLHLPCGTEDTVEFIDLGHGIDHVADVFFFSSFGSYKLYKSICTDVSMFQHFCWNFLRGAYGLPSSKNIGEITNIEIYQGEKMYIFIKT